MKPIITMSIRWDNMLGPEIQRRKKILYENIDNELEGLASLMEQFAKAHHPWQNQTGDAERTFTVKRKSRFVIEASHGVPYGIWLEVKWGGRYGIIPDTLDFGEKELRGSLAKAWNVTWQ